MDGVKHAVSFCLNHSLDAAGMEVLKSSDKVASADVSEEQIGTTHVFPKDVHLAGILVPEHAAEYAEYCRLHDQYACAPKAKARLIRKLDFRVLPILFVYYLLNSLDKSNAGNVKIYTFLEDTHMTSRQFNLALTWYFFTYAGFEAPSK